MLLLAIMSIRAPRANHLHEASHSQRFPSAIVGAGLTGQFMNHFLLRMPRDETELGRHWHGVLARPHRPNNACQFVGDTDHGAVLPPALPEPQSPLM